MGGFYNSQDGGRSDRISSTGLQDYDGKCIVPHPRDPNVIYLGCQGGVYKATDHSRTWQ